MSRTVLVVEDEPDIRELIRISLVDVGGLTVVTSGPGAAAVAAVDGHRPDAVLMDVQMPGTDGPATLALLRANGARVPVVFLTASAHDAKLAELGAMDVAGVLLKPFDPLALAAELAVLLGWDR